jgi:MOSC domain-containing protein YiiM
MLTIAELTSRFPRSGRLEWIGLRPGRRLPMLAVESAAIGLKGIEGDRNARPGPRAVTLIQHEHLPAIAALCGLAQVESAALRRNLVVSGISLTALKGRRFRIGGAVLEGADACAPCSRMEEALGPGGYNAMRGHGGLCAMVIAEGNVAIGDPVEPV